MSQGRRGRVPSYVSISECKKMQTLHGTEKTLSSWEGKGAPLSSGSQVACGQQYKLTPALQD